MHGGHTHTRTPPLEDFLRVRMSERLVLTAKPTAFCMQSPVLLEAVRPGRHRRRFPPQNEAFRGVTDYLASQNILGRSAERGAFACTRGAAREWLKPGRHRAAAVPQKSASFGIFAYVRAWHGCTHMEPVPKK
jgi:hypothetical protein